MRGEAIALKLQDLRGDRSKIVPIVQAEARMDAVVAKCDQHGRETNPHWAENATTVRGAAASIANYSPQDGRVDTNG